MLINAHWDIQTEGAAEIAWATEFYAALSPFVSEFIYVNAPDLAIKNFLERYYGSNLPRLVEVKKKYDPDNVFHFAQSIPTSLV